MRESDERLILQLLGGDSQAWYALVDRYGPLIRSRVADVSRMFDRQHDTAAIDDVTAEVFVALLANDSAALRAFAGRSRLGTYLAVIATRIAGRTFGRNSRRDHQRRDWEQTADRPCTDDAEVPLQGLVQEEDRRSLLELVQRLPTRQRELISLHYVDGLTYQEIQKRTGIPVGSIGPTLRRAEKRLRQWIEQPSDR